jgi:hypothetical protein
VVAQPDILNPFSFPASSNLGTRFLLRVVLCHIPKIGMWKLIKVMFDWLHWFENSQRIETSELH